MKRRKL